MESTTIHLNCCSGAGLSTYEGDLSSAGQTVGDVELTWDADYISLFLKTVFFSF